MWSRDLVAKMFDQKLPDKNSFKDVLQHPKEATKGLTPNHKQQTTTSARLEHTFSFDGWDHGGKKELVEMRAGV